MAKKKKSTKDEIQLYQEKLDRVRYVINSHCFKVGNQLKTYFCSFLIFKFKSRYGS